MKQSGNMLVIVGIGVAVLLGIGAIAYQNNAGKNMEKSAMEEKADVVMEKKQDDTAMMEKTGTYQEYSPTAFTAAADKKRVYFFHAKWCPTCKAANQEFSAATNIPAGVVLFKTDYDSETTLKSKYGITYQHTFVQVDSEGNEIAKWNGGGIKELAANLK